MQFLQLLGQKLNIYIHLNPTMMVFTRLFSWKFIIKDYSSTFEPNSKNKFDKTRCNYFSRSRRTVTKTVLH